MRQILVDHARSRHRLKRGSDPVRFALDEDLYLSTQRDADAIALDDAIEELQLIDSRQAKIVEMRFFGGMTVNEVAEVMGLSTRTIENEWKMCRAWLRRKLDEDEPS